MAEEILGWSMEGESSRGSVVEDGEVENKEGGQGEGSLD